MRGDSGGGGGGGAACPRRRPPGRPRARRGDRELALDAQPLGFTFCSCASSALSCAIRSSTAHHPARHLARRLVDQRPVDHRRLEGRAVPRLQRRLLLLHEGVRRARPRRVLRIVGDQLAQPHDPLARAVDLAALDQLRQRALVLDARPQLVVHPELAQLVGEEPRLLASLRSSGPADVPGGRRRRHGARCSSGARQSRRVRHALPARGTSRRRSRPARAADVREPRRIARSVATSRASSWQRCRRADSPTTPPSRACAASSTNSARCSGTNASSCWTRQAPSSSTGRRREVRTATPAPNPLTVDSVGSPGPPSRAPSGLAGALTLRLRDGHSDASTALHRT